MRHAPALKMDVASARPIVLFNEIANGPDSAMPVMKLISHASFDERQQRLTFAILEAVAFELKKVDAPEKLLEQLTGSIAFSVTALLDDVRSVDFGDGDLSPVVTFGLGDGELAYGGGNTWMHEYVYRLLPEVLRSINGVDKG